jgi:Putative zincin peptidase
MAATMSDMPAIPLGPISEWKPSRATWLVWTVLGTPMTVLAALGYVLIASRGALPASGSANLAQLALVAALIFGLAAVHEAVHGLVMSAFGASPEFGVLRVDGIPLGFFATAPGHRFRRRQYLFVALAPFLVMTPLGAAACLLPFGEYLAFPLAIVFGGCIGDLAITWHVLGAPPNVECEDLRDGVRFWKA